jgi:hypothetical protein
VLPAAQQEMPPRPTAANAIWRVDIPSRPGSHLTEFAVGRNRLAVSATRLSDRDAILSRTEDLAVFDLAEPFERIREAVEEAHKGGRVDQAA